MDTTVKPSKPIDPESFEEIAKQSGLMVLAGLEEAGVSPERIQETKERMAEWLNIVRNYDRDARELQARPMSHGDRQILLDLMEDNLDRARVEMFGEN